MKEVIIISALIASFSFLIKDIFKEVILGLWLRATDELEEGYEIKLFSNGKEVYEGEIIGFGLRNTKIKPENGNVLYIENSKIYENEVKYLNK